jgi:plastocyanin
MGHNGWLGAVFAFVVAFTARSGFACPRDGTDGPCHYLQKALAVLDDVQFAVDQVQQVHVFDFDFSTNPAGMPVMDATIHAGDTVHWTWDSGFHSVTSVAGSLESFDSGDQFAPSATFDHTFTHVGRITYYCNIHGFDNGNGTAGGMSGVITVLAPPGDANDDGKVNFTDLLILAQHYGQTTTDLTTGDFNGDGKIDFADLLILAQHYGQSDAAVSAASAVSPVPEPALAALAAAAIPLGLRRR